ncbi:thiol:disulfide interchange protein DsbA/DsbL [Massilia sp. B-10]|nr:thiol:disulfide interchange protein DsbA/DsbL [Massilia sp. B-10]
MYAFPPSCSCRRRDDRHHGHRQPCRSEKWRRLSNPGRAPANPAGLSNKIEVIEFFAYHCPHCYVIEADTAAWIKKQGGNINFKRIAYPFQGPSDPETHLFLTLEAMGKADEVSPKVFRAMHVERQRLMKDDAILEWVAKSSGLDKNKFLETWNSFGVLTKLEADAEDRQ